MYNPYNSCLSEGSALPDEEELRLLTGRQEYIFKEDTNMIEIIAGLKGHGKTKILIQKVNDDIKLTKGTIVYLDKNNKHMYELSNQIRLIVVPEFNIENTDMFIGFIESPINAGAAAMIAGLIVVPMVSLISPKLEKKKVDEIFECYEEKVVISRKRSLQE